MKRKSFNLYSLAIAFLFALTSIVVEAKEMPDIFIRPEISLKNGYVGQKIDYTLKMYSTNPEIAFAKPVSHILPNGCDVRIVNDLAEPYIEGTETIEGKKYTVAVLERKVVEPLSKGTMTIPAIDYIIGINHRRKVDDFFFGGFYTTETERIRVKSSDLKVKIKDLPSKRPADFTGAIGEFSLDVTVPKGNIVKGIDNIVVFTVKGTGSLADEGFLSLEDLNKAFPSDVKVKSMTDNEASYWKDGRYYTEKQYEIVFTPENTGEFTLAPATFTVFNPAKGKFETLSSKKITIEVKKSRHSGDEQPKSMSI